MCYHYAMHQELTSVAHPALHVRFEYCSYYPNHQRGKTVVHFAQLTSICYQVSKFFMKRISFSRGTDQLLLNKNI
jgi:hypothetical protein